MGDPNVIIPQDLGTLVTKILGGGAVAVALVKLLTVWGAKLNLNLSADQANASMREELRKDLNESRQVRAEMEKELKASKANEFKYMGQIAALEAEVKSLREEVERLRAFQERIFNGLDSSGRFRIDPITGVPGVPDDPKEDLP